MPGGGRDHHPPANFAFFSLLSSSFTSEKSQIWTGAFSCVPAADPRVARVSGCGKNHPCCRPMVARYLASKAGAFRQTGRDLRGVSMRTRTGQFAGFSRMRWDREMGIRGRIGLVWDRVCQAGSVGPVIRDRLLGPPHTGHLTRDGSATCDRSGKTRRKMH